MELGELSNFARLVIYIAIGGIFGGIYFAIAFHITKCRNLSDLFTSHSFIYLFGFLGSIFWPIGIAAIAPLFLVYVS